ncbi:hypothetical protein [Streptomyces sp. NPDC003327]
MPDFFVTNYGTVATDASADLVKHGKKIKNIPTDLLRDFPSHSGARTA